MMKDSEEVDSIVTVITMLKCTEKIPNTVTLINTMKDFEEVENCHFNNYDEVLKRQQIILTTSPTNKSVSLAICAVWIGHLKKSNF